MNKTVILLSLLTLLSISCSNRKKTAQEFYDENFKWKITIPDNLEAANPEKWEKTRQKGKQMIEDTYNDEVGDYTIPIFTFNDGQFNVFESMYETFDPEVDGDFLENNKFVNEILYETFITQMPGIIVDTLTTIEQIDNLDFYVFKIKVTYPNEITLNILMYSRLFDKKSFGLNIIYREEEIGQKMLDAWKNSTFEK